MIDMMESNPDIGQVRVRNGSFSVMYTEKGLRGIVLANVQCLDLTPFAGIMRRKLLLTKPVVECISHQKGGSRV